MSRHRDRTTDSAPGQETRRPARSRVPVQAPRGLRLAGWLSVAAVSILVLSTLSLYFKLRGEWDSIGHVTVNTHALGKRPPSYKDDLNILLIGSDTRTGQNAKIGGQDPGQRSDTVMVVHIAPGRHRVVVMSIPRDTVVPVLACPSGGGSPGQAAAPGAVERINATFAAGGPTCLWKTVEQETGIRINHFAELDFVGFEKVINSVGGVEVCLPHAVNVPLAGLHLPAGRQKIKGAQAIAFWRAREGLGLSDDPQRIQRDQFLMASLVQGIEHSNLLGSPSRVLSVISDVASSLTLDMDQRTLLSTAISLRGVSPKSVQFVTSPFEAYPGNPNVELQFSQPAADQMFSALAHDKTLPKTRKSKRKTAPPAGPAANVATTVLNGTQTPQLAATTAAKLTTRGFNVAGSGDATAPATTSVVEYPSTADLAAAKALKAQLGSAAALQLDPSIAAGTLTLILGSNFTALRPTGSSGTGKLTKTFGGIAGSANVCHDRSAFAG
ncbi:MAG: LCP family protein [Actinomycetota bacterium]